MAQNLVNDFFSGLNKQPESGSIGGGGVVGGNVVQSFFSQFPKPNMSAPNPYAQSSTGTPKPAAPSFPFGTFQENISKQIGATKAIFSYPASVVSEGLTKISQIPAVQQTLDNIVHDLKNFRLIASPTGPGEPGVNDVEYLKQKETGDLFHQINKAGGMAINQVLTGASGGIIPTPNKAETPIEKLFSGLGNIVGATATLKAIGGKLEQIATGSKTLASFAAEYPGVAKIVGPILKNVASFDIYGQLNPLQKNRLETLARDSVTGVLFSGVGFLKNAPLSVAANFGLGYGLAKADGQSDEDALISGGLLAALDVGNRVQQAAFLSDFSKRREYRLTPDEAKAVVVNTPLENTPGGKAIMKAAIEAKAGDEILITSYKTGPTKLAVVLGQTKKTVSGFFVELVPKGGESAGTPGQGAPTPEGGVPQLEGTKTIQRWYPNMDRYTSAGDYARAELGQPDTAKIGFLKPSEIVPRDPVDRKQVETVKKQIKAGETVEPIVVEKDNQGQLTTVDGTQRLVAFQEENKPVPVVYTGEDTVSGLKPIAEVFNQVKALPAPEAAVPKTIQDKIAAIEDQLGAEKRAQMQELLKSEGMTPAKYLKALQSIATTPKPTVFFRGGGEGSMPKQGTALDVVKYEREILGNPDVKAVAGVDLTKIPAKNLVWLTETAEAAKEYGPVTKVPLTDYRIVARDGNGGVLIEKITPAERIVASKQEVQTVSKGKTKPSKGITAPSTKARPVKTPQKPEKPALTDEDIARYVDSKRIKFRQVSEDELILSKPERELTTKFLEHPDIKGKEVASYSFLYNLSKSDTFGLKQIEREAIQGVLSQPEFKDNPKINMEDFRKAVKGQMLPIDIIKTDTYGDYGSDNIGQGSLDNKTYLLNTPFPHGLTGHFSQDFSRGTTLESDLMVKEIPVSDQNPTIKYAVVRKGVELTRENIEENVFTVTQSEEAAKKWIADHTLSETEANRIGGGKAGEKLLVATIPKGLFGHFRSFDDRIFDDRIMEGQDAISRIAEIQSDVFQHGIENIGSMREANALHEALVDHQKRLDEEKTGIEQATRKREELRTLYKFIHSKAFVEEGLTSPDSVAYRFNEEGINKRLELQKKYGVNPDIIPNVSDFFGVDGFQFDRASEAINNRIERTDTFIADATDMVDKITERTNETQKKYDEAVKAAAPPAPVEKMFKSYKNIWQERIVREAINIKAKEGFAKIRFPTPRTVAVIEGYVAGEEGNRIPYEVTSGDENYLEPGDTIDYGGEEFTVVQADGYNITVAPSDKVNRFSAQDAMDDDINARLEDTQSQFSDLEKEWGTIDTPEKAQQVIDSVDAVDRLAKFNGKAKDIKREADYFAENGNVKRDSEIIKSYEKQIPEYQDFLKLIKSGVMEKELLTKEAIHNPSVIDRLVSKYDTKEMFWGIIRDSYDTQFFNNEEPTTPAKTLKEAQKRVEQAISDSVGAAKAHLLDAQDRIKIERDAYDKKVKAIEDRKKPTAAELKGIPKKVIEENKDNQWGYSLDYGVERALDLMANYGSDEVSFGDIEEDWRSQEVDGYEPDFEGIYGKGHVFYEDRGNGYDQTVYTVESDASIEDFQQPDQYDAAPGIEDFKIDAFEGEQRTVLEFYNKQVIPYLQKLRRGNIELVTDDNGYDWWETAVTKDDVKAPTAYRIADGLAKAGIPVTPEQEAEIYALNKKIFGDASVKITAQIIANKRALGAYEKGIIEIMGGKGNAKETFYHEAVHKYLDAFTDRTEYIDLLREAAKVYKMNDLPQVEERLAEDFIKYAKKREGFIGKIKAILDKILSRISSYLKNKSKIEKLYEDILSGKAAKKMADKARETPVKAPKPVPPSKEPLMPVGTGTAKNSRLFERVKETLADPYNAESRPYNQLSLDKQAEQVVSLIETDPKRAARIAKGYEAPPSGMTQNAVSVAIADIAREKGDWKRAAEMWTDTSLRSTRLGQEIVSLRGDFGVNEPLNAVKNLLNARMEQASRRYGDIIKGLAVPPKSPAIKKVDTLVDHEVKKVKKIISDREARIQSAQDIINALRCK